MTSLSYLVPEIMKEAVRIMLPPVAMTCCLDYRWSGIYRDHNPTRIIICSFNFNALEVLNVQVVGRDTHTSKRGKETTIRPSKDGSTRKQSSDCPVSLVFRIC